jgi:hypothetical protein
MTMPPADLELKVNPAGNFYRSQTGALIHRVTLADAYAAGHVLFDDKGKPLTYEQFCALPANKLGLAINYDLKHEMGGTSVIDLLALLVSQQRGARDCAFVFVSDDREFRRALDLLRVHLGEGECGIGFDVASTEGETSNPSSVTVTEKRGLERFTRLIVVWKERKESIQRERIQAIVRIIAAREKGGKARRLCIDASNERLFAQGTADMLRSEIPVELVINGASIHPPGYDEPTNFKTYLGDLYASAVNENRYALPSDEYVKSDHRLPIKTGGRYECTADKDGKHGDTFDSGKLAEYALNGGAAEFGYTPIPRERQVAGSNRRTVI